MTFFLETERLFLRQFKDSDLEFFLEYRNDPEVAKYQGWDVPYAREKAIKFVGAIQGHRTNRGAHTLGGSFTDLPG